MRTESRRTKTAIYKGSLKPDTYLYVEREDDFKRVPQSLLDLLGNLCHVMTIELSANRKLAAADANEVMRLLQSQGYFLQLPPEDGPGGPLGRANRLVEYRRDAANEPTT